MSGKCRISALTRGSSSGRISRRLSVKTIFAGQERRSMCSGGFFSESGDLAVEPDMFLCRSSTGGKVVSDAEGAVLGAASGTTVSHVSDIVGAYGCSGSLEAVGMVIAL